MLILVGENDVQPDFNDAAERHGSIRWVVPKGARPGDRAVFLFNRAFFTGRGIVQTSPSPANHGRRSAFAAKVGDLELLARPLPLDEVAKRIPEWKWPRYPRSYTTARPEVASKLEALLGSGEGVATPTVSRSPTPSSGGEPQHGVELETAARWNALFPERQRESVARALSRSMHAAHALADTCWTVTLNDNFVRLSVGMPLALTLSSGECNQIVMDDPALLRSLARAGLRIRRQQEFGNAPGTISIVFPLGSLAEVHARAWRSHLQAMGLAAAKRRITPHRGYAFDLVAHLRAMGFDVPDSSCPEAMRLRAREKAGAARDSARKDALLEPFLPSSIEDGRRHVQASILRRRGQGAFRDAVLRAYNFSCGVTGCYVLDVLEAAHIVPYRGDATNHVQNGILLRADLHVLFDVGLLGFDSAWRVRLDKGLRGTVYGEFEGKPLQMPKQRSARPSREALILRKESRP